MDTRIEVPEHITLGDQVPRIAFTHTDYCTGVDGCSRAGGSVTTGWPDDHAGIDSMDSDSMVDQVVVSAVEFFIGDK